MERGAGMFGGATFVMDTGYDDNKMFLNLDTLKPNYAIRFTSKRRLFFPWKMGLFHTAEKSTEGKDQNTSTVL